jgi:hypothetical protein
VGDLDDGSAVVVLELLTERGVGNLEVLSDRDGVGLSCEVLV